MSSTRTSLTDIEQADRELLCLNTSLEACPATLCTSRTRVLITETQQRNSRLPIYQLPTEMMINIFQLYVEVERTPQRLALVSTVWAAIVMDSPTLWRYIDSNQPYAANLNSLARSKGAPLVVRYSGSQWRDWREDPDAVTKGLKLFIDSACGQVHRWQSASLIMGKDRELWRALVDRLAHGTAPLLETLEITGSTMLEFDAIDNLFNGVAPHLRHIEMTNISIPWDSSLFSHLYTLVVTGNSFTGPTAFQMAQIMRECPLLVELRMSGAPGEEDTTPIGVQSIELLAMETLSLRLNPIELNYILQLIRIPVCTQFHISSRVPRGNIFSGPTDHLIPVLSSMLHSTHFIDIRLSATQFTYKACQDSQNAGLPLSVSLDSLLSEQGTSPLNTLAWILDHIHPSSLSIPVKLSIYVRGLPLAELLASLQPYPVTTLNVRGSGRENTDIVQYLTQPFAVHGVSRWHLPSLRELSFEGYYNPKSLISILSLVESRLGLLDPSEPSGRRELPLKLTKLFIARYRYREGPAHKEFIEKLRALVDDVEYGLL